MCMVQALCRFQTLPYDALDVKNSAWYEDMATFRNITRDLEVHRRCPGIHAPGSAVQATRQPSCQRACMCDLSAGCP